MPRFVTGTTWDVQRDVARLQRIQRENNAGRMVAGLGARNVPWAQAHAGPLGADVSGYKGAVSAADQAAFARKQGELFSQRIGSYEGVEARMAQQASHIQRLQNLARKSGLAGPSGMDSPLRPGASTGSARDTLRQRLAKRGLGIETKGVKLGPIQWTRAGLQVNTQFMRSAQRFGGKLFAASFVAQVGAGVLGGAASAAETLRRTDSPIEAAKAGGLGTLRGARDSIAGVFAIDDITASIATLLGITPDRDTARRQQQSFYDDLFTTGEEKARRASAKREQLSAMYQEVNRNVGDMWALVNTTLPQSFALKKDDLSRFRTELARQNEQAIFALSQKARNDGERALEAGDASGG